MSRRRIDWSKNRSTVFAAPLASMAYDSSAPLVSRSGATTAGQAAGLRQFLKERGVVGAEVRNDGTVQFSSRKARRDFCRARGLIDQDGGYGDG